MSIISADIIRIFPEFDNANIAIIDRAIQKATLICDKYKWKSQKHREYAIQSCVAHELAVQYYQQLLMTNAISRIHRGEPIESWHIEDYYSASIYGQDFLRLLKDNRNISMFVI